MMKLLDQIARILFRVAIYDVVRRTARGEKR